VHICITDHNITREVERLKKAGAEYGLQVLEGMAVRYRRVTSRPSVYGIIHHIEILAKGLVEIAHSKEVVIPAHPFRASASSLGSMIF